MPPRLPSGPLYEKNPGYATLGGVIGWEMSRRLESTVLIENVFDRHHRVMGSGVDGPGLNLLVRQTVRF